MHYSSMVLCFKNSIFMARRRLLHYIAMERTSALSRHWDGIGNSRVARKQDVFIAVVLLLLVSAVCDSHDVVDPDISFHHVVSHILKLEWSDQKHWPWNKDDRLTTIVRHPNHTSDMENIQRAILLSGAPASGGAYTDKYSLLFQSLHPHMRWSKTRLSHEELGRLCLINEVSFRTEFGAFDVAGASKVMFGGGGTIVSSDGASLAEVKPETHAHRILGLVDFDRSIGASAERQTSRDGGDEVTPPLFDSTLIALTRSNPLLDGRIRPDGGGAGDGAWTLVDGNHRAVALYYLGKGADVIVGWDPNLKFQFGYQRCV